MKKIFLSITFFLIAILALGNISVASDGVNDSYNFSSKPTKVNIQLDVENEKDVAPLNRIITELEMRNLRVTFYVTKEFALEHPDIIKNIQSHGHEIALHGNWSNDLPYDEQLRLLNESINVLKNITGKEIIHYRPDNFSLSYEENNDVFRAVQSSSLQTLSGYITVGKEFPCHYCQMFSRVARTMHLPEGIIAVPISVLDTGTENVTLIDTPLDDPEKYFDHILAKYNESSQTKEPMIAVMHVSSMKYYDMFQLFIRFLDHIRDTKGLVLTTTDMMGLSNPYISSLDASGPDTANAGENVGVSITYSSTVYCPTYYFRIYGRYPSDKMFFFFNRWTLLASTSQFVQTGSHTFNMQIKIPEPPESDDTLTVRVVGQACRGGISCWPTYNRYEAIDEFQIKINKTCVLVSGSGNTARYDVVFVPAKFSKDALDSAFASAVVNNWNSVAGMSPFSAHTGIFNMWRVNKLDDAKLNCYQGCLVPIYGVNYSDYWCCNEAEAQVLASACPDHDTVDVLIDATNWGAYRNGPRCTTGGDTIVKTRTYPVANIHEFGHSFGLGDEYSPNKENFPPGYVSCANCDTSSTCPKWNATPECVMGCTYLNDYRSTTTSMMKDTQSSFNSVSISHLESEFSRFSSLSLMSNPLENPVAGQLYILRFRYENGTITFIDKNQTKGYAQKDYPDGSYRYEIISLSNVTLYSARFRDPSLDIRVPVPPESYVVNGTPINGTNNILVLPVDFVILAPYFFDGKAINVYNSTDDLVATVDVSQYITSALVGRVVDTNSTPVSYAYIQVSGSNFASTLTDTNGSYYITGLPEGSYTIFATPSPYDNLIESSTTAYFYNDGKTNSLNFTLQPTGSIAGFIINESGAPVTNVVVYTSGYETPRYAPDANGSYILSELDPGIYSVYVDASNTLYSDGQASVNVNLSETTWLNFTLKPGGFGALEGFVTAPNGTPVYGAYITISGLDYRSMYTDANGKYKFTRIKNGTYSVSVSPPYDSELVGNTTNITVAPFTTTSFNVTLPKGGIVQGFVVAYNGTPVYSAYVSVSGPSSRSAYTNENGSYIIKGLLTGKYTIYAEPSYDSDLVGASTTANVTRGETTNVNLTLPKGGMIIGKVLAYNGTAVYNSYVYLDGPIDKYTYTNSTGDFIFKGLRNGSYYVSVSPPSGSELVFNSTTINISLGETVHLNITLPLGGKIRGNVIAQNGTPVYNAYVYTSGPTYRSGYTDINGSFQFKGLINGTYYISVSPPHDSELIENSTYVNISLGQMVNLNIILQKGGKIIGTVIAQNGTPVYNAYVYISGPSYRSAYTDVNGSFFFKGLVNGSYYISASPPYGSELISNSTIINISLGKTVSVNITLPLGGKITGMILAPNGTPVYYAYVYVSGPSYRSVYTDVNGSFFFKGLPNGSYYISVSPPYDSDLISNSTTVNVSLRETTNINITLPKGGKIIGTVIAYNGTPVYNAYIYISGPSYRSVYTDVNGSFFFKGLMNGTYYISVSPPYDSDLIANSTTVNVPLGQTISLNITLPKGGKITGTVSAPNGTPVYNAYVYISGPSYKSIYTNINGSFAFKGLVNGTYYISVSPPYGSELLGNYTTINVSLGETLSVNITLPKGGKITGTVFAYNGTPVYSAYVSVSGPNYISTYTNTNGSYEIKQLEAGEYTINVYPPYDSELLSNYTTTNVSLGETVSLNITLPMGGKIRPTISAYNGTKVYNVYVSISGPSYGYCYTNVNGVCEIKQLLAGEYYVSATPPYGSELIGNSTIINISLGETVSVNITLPLGGKITGIVVAYNGTPVYGASISASGPSYGYAYTDMNGTYEIKQLLEGEYYISVSPPYDSELIGNSTTINISLGETVYLNMILPMGGKIIGTVFAYNGTAVDNAYISVSGPSYGYDYTDVNGTFEIKKLQSGEYTVYVQPPYEAHLMPNSSVVNVTIGETVIVSFILERASTLIDHYSDYGLDIDENGLYDYLVIDVGVNITRAGNYYLYGSIRDSSYNYFYSANSTYLDSGVQVISLYFNGVQIYRNSINSLYVLSYIYLYYEGLGIDHRYDAYNTSYYNYTQFQKPPARLSGNYSDNWLDTDSDGLYDYLSIDVGLDVGKNGDYIVCGEIYDDRYYYVTRTCGHAYLDIGNQKRTLNFFGPDIFAANYNGTLYLRNVYVYDKNNNMLDYDYDAFTTSYYNYMSFENETASCGSKPIERCKVMKNTTFVRDVYYLYSGIAMGSNSTLLDCNGASLVGITGLYEIGISSYDKSGVMVRNCNISDFGLAVYLSGTENSTIEKNNIVKNMYGVILSEGSAGNNISKNNIFNNTYYNLYNYQPADVTAENNYWGANNVREIAATIYDYYDDATFGVVDFDPWLATPVVRLTGDTNGDCTVNIFDLARVGVCFGRPPAGDCAVADLNRDGFINIIDLATVGKNFGKTC